MVEQGDENPYVAVGNSTDLFKDKRVVLFLYEHLLQHVQLINYQTMTTLWLFKNNIDEVYCLSVNDSFVMNKWGDWLDIDNVKFIPDGSVFTEQSVGKERQLGLERRSLEIFSGKYGESKFAFVEDGCGDDCPTDPYEVSDPYTMMNISKRKSSWKTV